MEKIRKAITAGFAAAVATLFTGLATEIPRTSAGWLALGGAALGAGVIAGYAVWQTPNAPAAAPTVTTRSGPAPY